MNKVIVLGLGNDLLTDDAVGLRITHEVQHRVAGNAAIEVRETMEAGPALLDFIVGADAVIIVDSIQTGEQPPGYVHEFEPPALPDHPARSPHALGIDTLCRVGRAQGLKVPTHVRLIAVEVEDPFTLGAEMTPEVEQAIDDAADLAVQRAFEFVHATDEVPHLQPSP